MKRPDATRASRTADAPRPRASRSRPICPSSGSVMFWLATAPTLARTCTHRAATAGEDDEMTVPNIPVSGQRAVREKVMPSSLDVGNDGHGVDFDEPLRPRQCRYDEAGRDGEHALQMFSDLAVDRFAVAWIGDVDRDFADVFGLCARLFEQGLDVRHRLFGLAGGVADRNARRGVEILSDLASYENKTALGDHRLAQIVVEALLGIGVLGVELANPSVSHRASRWPLEKQDWQRVRKVSTKLFFGRAISIRWALP